MVDFVTLEDVRRACSDLGIRDWSQLNPLEITSEEARLILGAIGSEALEVSLADFREGLQVELEHGKRFPDANITNNHPMLTGKIVLAHLKESLLYYYRLAMVELEGDILKAMKEGNLKRLHDLSAKLAKARVALSNAELDYLASDT